MHALTDSLLCIYSVCNEAKFSGLIAFARTCIKFWLKIWHLYAKTIWMINPDKILISLLQIWVGIYWKQSISWKVFNKQSCKNVEHVQAIIKGNWQSVVQELEYLEIPQTGNYSAILNILTALSSQNIISPSYVISNLFYSWLHFDFGLFPKLKVIWSRLRKQLSKEDFTNCFG